MNISSGKPSTFIKMQQVYWEAKQSFNKSFGQREDSCIVSSDNDLDTRLGHLQSADNYFNLLMRIVLKYRDALQNLVNVQENFGIALIEYGTRDSTAAGKVLWMSGKTICKSSQKQIQLKTHLMNLFYEVQTFQFNATADAFQTVTKMEKVRKSYRSGLLWLKNESTNLDPDVSKKLKNFKRVQEHVKRLKVKFDGAKLESMQKIDLYLLSRSNLFSNNLVYYNKAFKKICKHTVNSIDYTLKSIPLCLSYNFVALKELNQYSKILQQEDQKEQSLKQIPKKQESVRQTVNSTSISPISDESACVYPHLDDSLISKNISNDLLKFEDVKTDKQIQPQTNEPSQNSCLIDLNNEEDKSPSTKLFKDIKYPPSSKYSEDLHSINFGDYQTKCKNEFFNHKLEKKYQHLFVDSNSRNNSVKETGDLKFWSLIKSCSQTTNLKEFSNIEADNSSIICPKQYFTKTFDSKWDDILIQFDPFLEQMPNQKIKSDNLELC